MLNNVDILHSFCNGFDIEFNEFVLSLFLDYYFFLNDQIFPTNYYALVEVYYEQFNAH